MQEYDSLLSGERRTVKFESPDIGQAGCAAVWCDILTPTTAEVLARYDEDFYAGQPAVTLNRIGLGDVIYVGTTGDTDFVNSVVRYATRLAGVEGLMPTPPQVEVTARWNGDERLLFVLNHANTPQSITLNGDAVDLISQKEQSGTVTLQPKQVMILRQAT